MRQLVQRVYFATVVYAVSFMMGAAALSIHDERWSANSYAKKIDERAHTVEVIVREKLKPTVNNHRYVALVKTIDGSECSGQLLMNLRRSTTNKLLKVGQRLPFTTVIYKHRKPSNPFQFDYGKYLNRKSITAQAYVNESQLYVATFRETGIWYYAGSIRDSIIDNLTESGFPPTELAVLSALILGQQQDISKDVLQDYQYAGAVHILSVSGLHVGFILLFINSSLKFLPNNKRNSYVRVITVLICLWGFAVLAGLSPSVVRSVTMFSFVAIGMHIRRTTNIFHTLLVSMLLILLFKPTFLFDVGFQLSYLALFFILWLQPKLAMLWQPKWVVLRYFWDILTVSFAAQLGALPLSIYYFHQFPGLFFVTNLIIIPFLSIIMAVGVIVLIIAALTTVPQFMVVALAKCIGILNAIIASVASFDDFVIKDISYSWPILLASYLAICCAVYYWQSPTHRSAIAALITVVMLQLVYIHEKWVHQSATALIVFDIRKQTLIAERRGNHIDVYCNDIDSTFATNALNTYKIASFNKTQISKPIQNMMFHSGKKILLIDSTGVYPPVNPHIIILTQSPKINLIRLLVDLKPTMIIADGSNYKSYIALWKQTCEKQKIPFHATGERGFYQLK